MKDMPKEHKEYLDNNESVYMIEGDYHVDGVRVRLDNYVTIGILDHGNSIYKFTKEETYALILVLKHLADHWEE